MEKLELQKIANEVRKDIVTAIPTAILFILFENE